MESLEKRMQLVEEEQMQMVKLIKILSEEIKILRGKQ